MNKWAALSFQFFLPPIHFAYLSSLSGRGASLFAASLIHSSNPTRGTNEIWVVANEYPLLEGEQVAEGHAAPHASISLSAHWNNTHLSMLQCINSILKSPRDSVVTFQRVLRLLWDVFGWNLLREPPMRQGQKWQKLCWREMNLKDNKWTDMFERLKTNYNSLFACS